MATHGFSLVYGGGSIGLMGTLARSMLRCSGNVIGVIPKGLLECEVGMVEASELIVTTTMRERKAIMEEKSDAFVVLPGGFGTVEELMETLTLRQLGYHGKPIIILNLHGYYTPLFQFFAHLVDQGYLSENHTHLYSVVSHVNEAMDVLVSLKNQSQEHEHEDCDQPEKIREKRGAVALPSAS